MPFKVQRSLADAAPVRRSLASRVRFFVAVALVGVTTSVCGVDEVSGPGRLVSITVTPNATLAAASTQQMVAVGFDADREGDGRVQVE